MIKIFLIILIICSSLFAYDLNCDGRCDLLDFAIIAKDYGSIFSLSDLSRLSRNFADPNYVSRQFDDWIFYSSVNRIDGSRNYFICYHFATLLFFSDFLSFRDFPSFYHAYLSESLNSFGSSLDISALNQYEFLPASLSGSSFRCYLDTGNPGFSDNITYLIPFDLYIPVYTYTFVPDSAFSTRYYSSQSNDSFFYPNSDSYPGLRSQSFGYFCASVLSYSDGYRVRCLYYVPVQSDGSFFTTEFNHDGSFLCHLPSVINSFSFGDGFMYNLDYPHLQDGLRQSAITDQSWYVPDTFYPFPLFGLAPSLYSSTCKYPGLMRSGSPGTPFFGTLDFPAFFKIYPEYCAHPPVNYGGSFRWDFSDYLEYSEFFKNQSSFQNFGDLDSFDTVWNLQSNLTELTPIAPSYSFDFNNFGHNLGDVTIRSDPYLPGTDIDPYIDIFRSILKFLIVIFFINKSYHAIAEVKNDDDDDEDE